MYERPRNKVIAIGSGLVTAVVVASLLVFNVDNRATMFQRLSTSTINMLTAVYTNNDDDEIIRRTWTQSELIDSFPEIQAYLDSVEATTEDMDYYVPRELVIEMRPRLVRQQIGAQASKGYVAMSLYSLKNMTGAWIFNSSWTTNYLILVSLSGELKSMLPITCCDGTTHFDALKPYDDKTFTVGGNYLNSESGEVYLWNWHDNTLTDVSGGNAANAHDVQWSNSLDDTFYTPTDWGFAHYEAYTGNILEDITLFDIDDATDVNHAQLIDHDQTVLVSDRTYNRMALYNRSTGVIEWTCGGGTSSTLDMYDSNGIKLSSDDSLFYGQHNAEYFGESEYYIFDNNYNSANALEDQGKSRAIIVNIDAKQKKATLAWEYEFPGFAYVFGDNDRLPSSNILTTWWPYVLTKDTGVYDVNVMEVTREKETAWNLKVLGQGCDFDNEAQCDRSIYQGWKVYSAERFYTEPLVYNSLCKDDVLTFDTHNTFKTNNAYPGSILWITHDDKETLADVNFEWSPFWRTTSVTVSARTKSSSFHAKTKLIVTNKVGQSTIVDVQCTYSETEPPVQPPFAS